ncbi:MAG TPA: 3D domain-containing protein [Gaiellaceae bacterium]
MRWRRESRLALGLLVVVGVLLASLTGARGAGPKENAGELHRRAAGLSARSHDALLGLYALDSQLAAARSRLEVLRGRVDALRREQRVTQREAVIVRGNMLMSQQRLAAHLRMLYEEGEPDAIAVMLGASSLDEALTRLEELEQSANQGARAAQEAETGRARLGRLAVVLAERVGRAQELEARARRTAEALAGTRAQRVAYIASLERERRFTERQIATLEASARRVVRHAQVVEAQAATPTAAEPASAPAAPGALAVTATGYALAGQTSTGLPVGPGVVAVDPTVIPLGTRISIPGYGEGVAADTGSGVQGNAIDIWFPTMADALAWGRRTVTITLH